MVLKKKVLKHDFNKNDDTITWWGRAAAFWK